MKKRIYGQNSYILSGGNGGLACALYLKSDETIEHVPSAVFNTGGPVHGIKFTDDGNYVAMGVWNSKPLELYKRNGTNFAKLTVPNSLSTANGGYRVDITKDGQYLAVAVNTEDSYVNWYRRDGDTVVRLPSPAIGTPGGTVGVQWDPTGTYLAFSKLTNDGGYLAWYKRDGNALVKLPNPSTMPSAVSDTIFWSPDGKYLALSMRNAERFIMYRREGDTLVKVTDNIPNEVGSYNAAFSPDGKYLALGLSYAPWVSIYRIDGETFTHLPNAFGGQSVGNSSSLCLEYSNDGKYLVVSGYYQAPSLLVYKIDNETYTKMTTGPDVTVHSRSVAMWTDYVEVEDKFISFAKVNSLPATLAPNTIYMVPGASINDLKCYISSSDGSSVRRVVDTTDVQAMLAQSVASLNEVAVVADITARNALGTSSSKMVLVLDATGDPTVSIGSATYYIESSTGLYHKVSERESMDLQLSWDRIVNGVLSGTVEIDEMVAMQHGHYDLTGLQQISIVAGELYLNGQGIGAHIDDAEW